MSNKIKENIFNAQKKRYRVLQKGQQRTTFSMGPTPKSQKNFCSMYTF